MEEYRIYVGLNDRKTHVQKFSEEKYLNVLKVICRNYNVSFSVIKMEGGYFHKDATFVNENALQLTFFNTEYAIIKEIAKDLCTAFNQETVIITSSKIDVEIICGENFDE